MKPRTQRSSAPLLLYAGTQHVIWMCSEGLSLFCLLMCTRHRTHAGLRLGVELCGFSKTIFTGTDVWSNGIGGVLLRGGADAVFARCNTIRDHKELLEPPVSSFSGCGVIVLYSSRGRAALRPDRKNVLRGNAWDVHRSVEWDDLSDMFEVEGGWGDSDDDGGPVYVPDG